MDAAQAENRAENGVIGAIQPLKLAAYAASPRGFRSSLGDEGAMPELRRDWLAQLRSPEPQVASREGGAGRFLDLHLYQFHSTAALPEKLGGEV